PTLRQGGESRQPAEAAGGELQAQRRRRFAACRGLVPNGRTGSRSWWPLTPKRGEIHLVSFDPALGAEIQKTRPALILQNDIGNQHSPVTIVAAITSNVGRQGPTGVLVAAPEGGLTVDSIVLLNQIRTVDKRRFVK